MSLDQKLSQREDKGPPREGTRDAAEVIAGGGIVAYPTETVYGLGVNPFDEVALDKLYRLKSWKTGPRPISLLLLDKDQIYLCVSEVPEVAWRLIEAFWPGPLTLVLSALSSLSLSITGKTGTVGLRMSGHSKLRELLGSLEIPITSTSANPTGLPPARTAREVEAYFGGAVDLILPNPTGEGGGTSSTVVKVVEEGEWFLIRAGAISERRIVEVLARGGHRPV